VDLDPLRQRFLDAEPALRKLVTRVTEILDSELASRSMKCEVDGRVKDVASFIKKALRKGYADPWAETRDKAGVRVIAIYETDLAIIDEAIRGQFTVLNHEDKRATIDPTRLDYLGIHYEVSLQDANIRSIDENDLRDMVCEIQVHTRAQNLWATVAHELVYKAPQAVPDDLRRSIHRLMALLELFDKEVAAGREAIMSQPGYEEARMLDALEHHFYALTARPSDRELSLHIIRSMLPLIEPEELAHYERTLDQFVNDNRDKLAQIYEQYLDDTRNPLMSQPESLMIFERLVRDRYTLVDAWLASGLPESLLESLSEIWGSPIEV
jgi:ppGpp synthetase/RelA/SpoT-type nucleotidyltranferase